MKTKAWLAAFRLHTLPLALSCILLGNAIAFAEGKGSALIFALSFITAIILQILSNVANDYGDFKNGADNEKRVGPARMTQQKIISESEMKRGIIILVILSLICGLSLLAAALPKIGWLSAGILLGIGILSIIAAITYTASSKPYGYSGWGDLSVFIFFGLVGVCGPYYLETGTMNMMVCLPAAGIGLLSAGVLNVNNIRDYESDKDAGKKTIAVRLGLAIAKMYHWSILISAILLFFAFAYFSYQSTWHYLFFLPGLLLINNGIKVGKSKHAKEVVPLLKQLVIATLIFTLSFIISLWV